MWGLFLWFMDLWHHCWFKESPRSIGSNLQTRTLTSLHCMPERERQTHTQTHTHTRLLSHTHLFSTHHTLTTSPLSFPRPAHWPFWGPGTHQPQASTLVSRLLHYPTHACDSLHFSPLLLGSLPATPLCFSFVLS
jgi:hypothetical protein